MSSPKYFPGFEPSEIQNKIIPFLSRVNSSFPSGVIDRENWGLTSLRFQAKELCEELGYSRVSDFLRAYGFEIAESDFLTFDDYFSVGIHADEDKTDTSSKAKQEPVNHTRYMPKNSEKVSYAKEKKPAKFGLYIPILIIIALLCFGGYWAYQNYFQNFADNPRLIEKASDSVYILYCYDKNNKDPVSLGSGFAALEDDLVITNFHVVENISTIEVRTENGTSFNLDMDDVLVWDRDLDIAILKCPRKNNIALLPSGNSTELMKGSKVIVIGNPKGYVNTISSGIYSGITKESGIDYIQFDAAVSSGSSGGPIFDNKGKVIGMTTWTRTDATGLNFGVPIEQIKGLLDKYNSGYYNSSAAKSRFEAEKLLNQGEFDKAKKIFDSLGMTEMVNECNYQLGLEAYHNGNYEKAMYIFEDLADLNYKDSKEANKTSEFYYATEIVMQKDEKNYNKALVLHLDLIFKGMPEAEESLNLILPTVYDYMVRSYNKGRYSEIKDLVETLDKIGYKDSKQYKILLRRHNSFNLFSVTSQDEFRITNNELQILLGNIDLADTKEALLSNHRTARMFLEGTWVANTGAEFSIDNTGYLSDGLPRVIYGEGYWEIEDSNLKWYTSYDTTKKLDKKITIVTRDKIEIYCYANSQTYTLIRQ